jgi:hypothetical protein
MRFSLVNIGGLSTLAAKGVINRKLRRRSIVLPRFPVTVYYTLVVYQAPFGSYISFFAFSIMAKSRFRPLGSVRDRK